MQEQLSNDLVSVIIVTYCRDDLLVRCLESIRAQTYRDREVIVVINSCSDNRIERWASTYPEIKFVANSENRLYCRANNQGLALSRGRFIFCLNDDLVLKDNFLEEMVKAALRDERIGSVSGCIFREDGRRIDSTGLFLARSRKPVERGYGRRYNRQYDQAGYIFGAGGAAALYRRRMLEEISIAGEYFDENYGIYYEDLDISWRAHNKGWKSYYWPWAIAYHTRGGSVRKNEPKASFLKRYNFSCLNRGLKLCLVKNRYSTIIKNDRLKDFCKNLPWIFAYEVKLWTYLAAFEPGLLKDILRDLGFVKSAYEKRKSLKAKV